MATALKYYLCQTEVGWIGLAVSGKGLRGTTTPQPSREAVLRQMMELGAAEPASETEAGALLGRLRDYAKGKPVRFDDVRIDWDGVTPSRRRVLAETLRIPWGETRSYEWLAKRVSKPGAARAVGQAMARNPFPVIIPCHRVVASNGSLGGYGGGLEMKAALLRLEGAR
jgi:methylated-DNA-[protein]-cysteine S-methyltransferase